MVTKEKLMDLETDVIKKAGVILAVALAGIILGIGIMAGDMPAPQGGGGGGMGGGMGGGGYPMISPGANRTIIEGHDIYNDGWQRNADRIDNLRMSDSDQGPYYRN